MRPGSLPLPRDVALGEFGTGLFYERYSAFGWAWSWRRTLLFGLVAMPLGAVFGLIHGLYAHDFGEGVAVAWHAAAANLVMVGCGPCLAAWARSGHWSRSTERTLVSLAVLVGIAATTCAWEYAETFHDRLMGRPDVAWSELSRLLAGPMEGHSLVEFTTNAAAQLGVYAVFGGALALRGFFGEPQRWREHDTRLALEASQRQQLETERRLALLQAQVEPHFLFNTLASVRSLIQSEPHRAAQTIDALAEYLRSTLPRLRTETGTAASTLGEQFEICRRFLALMDVRLGGRLTVEIDLPNDLAALPFPPLLLISLVENAVRHGVEPKVGAAVIALGARRVVRGGAAVLEVEVCDDGVGLEEGLAEGTGLANVRGQLQVLYGRHAQLAVESRTAGGVRAAIAIPLARAAA